MKGVKKMINILVYKHSKNEFAYASKGKET
jgi:hypothetical protein